MPRYSDIPTAQKFKDDSSVLVAVRSSDKTLGQIDRLLADYQGSTATDQVTILYYLYLAAKFWRKNVGATLKNTPPSGFSDPGNTLPGTGKVSGNEGRRDAVTALSDILEEKLLKQFAMEDSAKLPEHLAELYGCANHGVASDADWLSNPSSKDAKNYTVYLTDDGMRRRYKLHFRSGLAYRWKDVSDTTSGYVKFDTNDNKESEGGVDQKCHFAMNKSGRIYIGFDDKALWFKHSSLLGGDDALAAGRMNVTQGKITTIDNDSGHYHPEVRHMVNLLQRLSIYGADLTHMTVRRMSDKTVYPAVAVLNKLTAWPDGTTGW